MAIISINSASSEPYPAEIELYKGIITNSSPLITVFISIFDSSCFLFFSHPINISGSISSAFAKSGIFEKGMSDNPNSILLIDDLDLYPNLAASSSWDRPNSSLLFFIISAVFIRYLLLFFKKFFYLYFMIEL